MRTSNINLLAEIDTLEEITRKDASKLEVVKYIEQLESEKSTGMKVKWFNTDGCEYPDIPEYEDSVDVWVYDGERVSHGYYLNPEMDVCYFTNVNGDALDDISIWAVFTAPYPPK